MIDAAEIGLVASEVDEESQWETVGLEVGTDLGVVCLAQGFDSLELQDHQLLDHQVEAVPPDHYAIVVNDDLFFDLCQETSFPELDEQSTTINTLQETGPKHPMHADDTGNDALSESVIEGFYPLYLHYPHIPLG